MYEIAKWSGNSIVDWKTSKEVKLTVSTLSLNNEENDNLFNSISIDPESTDEGIDATEIKFKASVKGADRMDYTIAVISGLLSEVINYKVVGNNKLLENANDPKEIIPILNQIWKMCGCTDGVIEDFDNQLQAVFQNAENKIHEAPEFKELVKDFARGLSYKALLCSVFSQLTGVRFGTDSNGQFTIKMIPEEKRVHGFTNAVYAGFMKWIAYEAYEYKKTGHFQEEVNDIVKFPSGMKKLTELIKELSASNLFNSKTFNNEKFDQWIVKTAESIKWPDNKNELGRVFVRQALPVMFNKAVVRTYYFFKTLIREIKNRNVKSVEGLAFVNLDFSTEEKALIRMETVSTGVFTAINISHAAAKGAIKAVQEEGDIEKVLLAFASCVNFVNLFEFVTVVRADAGYIVDDLKEAFVEHGSVKVKDIQPVNKEILVRYTGLNKVETQLLYSLELQDIKEDIFRTKKNDEQLRKNEWCEAWKDVSRKSVDLSKLYFEDKEKVYSALTTHAFGGANNDWLYRIILELALFKPYFSLDIEDYDNKRFKNLKPCKFNYLKQEFVKYQNVIDADEVEALLKSYGKQLDYLDGKTEKKVAGIVGTVAVGAAAAGAAFVFAPAIAVALVGSSFTGIYGAALTNASLALLGGGALSAGGLGMAGGTMVIAGGGAALGLSATGATATAMILLSSPEYVKVDYAKLLTNCEYVMLGKYGMTNEVKDIRNIVQKDYEDLGIRMSILEEKIRQSTLKGDELKAAKQLEKSINESRTIIRRSVSALDKMIDNYRRK